jgi:DNA excision repair protein ERCC-5
MLDILGITYIIAPFEAEAQCATLEEMGLVDGVVTEDSDVFLFGGRKVYRGVFQDNIKLYWMGRI